MGAVGASSAGVLWQYRPPEKSPPGDILPVKIRPPADFYREKIAGGDFLHELILTKKSPPPWKIHLPYYKSSPAIKMSLLTKTAFVTLVWRFSQRKILPRDNVAP